jgi:5-methylcytosine-specific restriction endonuclease McrA
MPIRAEMRDRYPADWPQISLRIRTERAQGRCECTGWCGAVPHEEDRCTAVNGRPHPLTGSKVVLTVAHRDHAPENCDPANLAALCQRCHLVYDAEQHKAQASHTRAVRAAGDAVPLFPDPTAADAA